MKERRRTINIDADLTNADWTKGTWDLPVDGLKATRAYLKQQGHSVAAFKKRPIYTLNLAARPWLKDL